MSLTDNTINTSEKGLPENKKQLSPKLSKLGWGLSLTGAVLMVVAFSVDKTRASFNLLILLMFLMSIGLGSLFLVALEYAAGAVWSVPFRRISEFLSGVLFILPVIVAVLIFNMHDLYHWTHLDAVKSDVILTKKSPYLNTTFFIIRTAVFMGLWLIFRFFLIRNSKKQDKSKDPRRTTKNIKLSAVFIPVFAISLTFSAIDWMMSLEPHWYSTIYGVYYFAGTILTALSAATIIIVLLSNRNYFPFKLIKDHYYSFGALMFAFVNFWAYIAFSQYMLIWYSNIPEETTWLFARWAGSWKYVSLGLIFIHFVIPYFALLSQTSKMNPKRLLIMSVWLLAAHYYDLYWLIMPSYSRAGAVFGWMEIAFPVAAIGIVIVLFILKAKNNNLIPVGDPKLQSGIDFRL
ncbi:MAG: quinol:cytochrome C oxidoreductase [Ignavibacteria bacterium]